MRSVIIKIIKEVKRREKVSSRENSDERMF